MRYWLDANIFITAKNTLYAFEINSSLWAWIDRKLQARSICVPSRVFREIMDYKKDDLLKQWAKPRKQIGMCIEPDKRVWQGYTKIADYLYTANVVKLKKISRRYSQAQIEEFSRGADPMVIAHAMADEGTVVSFESHVKPDSRKIRIPDVCEHFGVPCIDLKGLLVAFGEKL